MSMLKQIALGATFLALSAGLAAAAPAVAEADLNVRAGPGTGYAVVGVVADGETVDVLNCGGSWCQVAFDGGTGYANGSYLVMEGVAESYVTPPSVYVEPEPSYTYGYGYYDAPRAHRGPRHQWRGGNRWQGRGEVNVGRGDWNRGGLNRNEGGNRGGWTGGGGQRGGSAAGRGGRDSGNVGVNRGASGGNVGVSRGGGGGRAASGNVGGGMRGGDPSGRR